MHSEITVKLGFSPCPNDTFIFDALVNKRINTRGIDFDITIADVEYLNKKAFRGELDFTKLSFYAWLNIHDKYILLDSGAALGRGCGPLIIAKKKSDISELSGMTIGIPGKYTTANMLLSIFVPYVKNKKEMLFSDIFEAVDNGIVDAGLIIHEDRFTYEKRGFVKIADLGELWERNFNYPVPLGGIFAKRDLQEDLIYKVNSLIKESILFAFNNPACSINFIKEHSSSIADDVIRQHINLYVNEYSISLGEQGRSAVDFLCKKSRDFNLEINNSLSNFIKL